MNFLSLILMALLADRPQAVTLNEAAEAHKAAIANLQSGEGRGTFQFSEQAANADSLQIKRKGKIHVLFDRERYHVALDYERHDEGVDRQVIIYDGSALIAASFSKRINPVGSEGEIFPIRAKGLVRPIEVDFPWDVRFLPSQVGNPEPVVQKAPPESIKANQMPNGNWRFKFPLGKFSTSVLEVAPNCGFNVVSLRADDNDTKPPSLETRATWEKKQEIWFVTSLSKMERLPDGRIQRYELNYDSFEVNPSVAASSFNLDALGLNDKSRILDRRPNAPQRRFYYHRHKKAAAKKLDNVVAELEQLPTTRRSLRSDKVSQRAGLPTWFFAFNGIAAFGLIGSGIGYHVRKVHGVRASRRLCGEG